MPIRKTHGTISWTQGCPSLPGCPIRVLVLFTEVSFAGVPGAHADARLCGYQAVTSADRCPSGSCYFAGLSWPAGAACAKSRLRMAASDTTPATNAMIAATRRMRSRPAVKAARVIVPAACLVGAGSRAIRLPICPDWTAPAICGPRADSPGTVCRSNIELRGLSWGYAAW